MKQQRREIRVFFTYTPSYVVAVMQGETAIESWQKNPPTNRYISRLIVAFYRNINRTWGMIAADTLMLHFEQDLK
jgi:hypothetical protein